jgi:hypothetical protein
MEGQYLRCICRACLLFLLALIAVSPTIAQQGQYKLNNLPFSLSGMTSQGGIATYSPIKTVTGESILLKDDDGNVFTFTLDANTVFCQGDTKVSDWSYLKKVLKKASVTVLTNDFTDKKALVIWDRAPKISKVDKEIVFDLPPMCK